MTTKSTDVSLSLGESTARVRTRTAPLRGYLIVIAGTLLWAQTGIFVKALLTRYGMEAFPLAFWRVFIVTAGLFAALLALNPRLFRISRRDLPVFFLYGLVGVALHQIVWITSVEYNGAAVATVLVYISPAIVAFFAWRLFREQMTAARWLAFAVTLAGCLLVSRAYDTSEWQLNPLGLVFGVGTGFTFAGYTLMGRLTTRSHSAWTALFYAFLFGMLLLLPANLLADTSLMIRLPADGWLMLLFLSLVPTLGGFAAYTIGLSHLPASVASLLSAFEPVAATIIAYFVFGEVLAPLQLVGSALVLYSVLTLRPRDDEQPTAAAPAS